MWSTSCPETSGKAVVNVALHPVCAHSPPSYLIPRSLTPAALGLRLPKKTLAGNQSIKYQVSTRVS